MQVGLVAAVPGDERVPQQLLRRPPPRRDPLQAARHEMPELRRRGGRRLRRLRHAYGAEEAGPVAGDPEGEPAQVDLQHADAEAPDVPGVGVVGALVDVGVDPLGAHVRDGADGGIAVHGLRQRPAHPEIGDLDLVPGVDQQIGGLDVAMHDLAGVQVMEALEDLVGDAGKAVLVAYVGPVEGAAVHVLEKHVDLAGGGAVAVGHVVAADDVGVVDFAEDLDFPADLEEDALLVVVPVDYLEGVEAAGGAVDDLIDRAAVAAADPAEAVEFGEVERAGAGGGGGGIGRAHV